MFAEIIPNFSIPKFSKVRHFKRNLPSNLLRLCTLIIKTGPVASHDGVQLTGARHVFHGLILCWPLGAVRITKRVAESAFSFQDASLFAALSIVLAIGAALQIGTHSVDRALLAKHGFFQLIESHVVFAFLPASILDTSGLTTLFESFVGLG